eukprot:CAMPEP_0196717322 /NCGR_PEP_ID=MMETSP1091-20130531/703_1 /TAXON_ID=302021 /ORGANISM="Rhodomonas sp., Strain CCMP768" /LENGTH=99 /DNA_ID=CAMNT_0042057601 /DNA_START=34 /DNA_END=333 /DNA_ORIENTATION=-
MGRYSDIPKYPVVNSHPRPGEVMANFRSKDYMMMLGCGAASMPFGWMAGTSRLPQMRVPSMVTAAIVGATGGFCIAFQQSGFRLMGFVANDEEVKLAKQ